jgi:electron transfer flavoprotein beta subunit
MALKVREQYGGTVTVITMGPPSAAEVLRAALYRGADRVILLSDKKFAGADTLATSYALKCAIEKIGDYDLIFCGRQAIDGDTAQVGPAIAAHLGRPQAAYVRRIPEADAAALTVETLTDYGAETLRVPLPAVLTVLKDLNVPRLPSLESQMRARRCAVERWRAGDIGGDPAQFGLDGSPTRVVRVFTPPARSKCVMWEGDADSSVGALADALRREGFA